MDYLEQIEKTGAYRFRRGIPEHLRLFFPGKGTVWREHLNTKVETEARPRCLEVAARVERLFQQAQARHDAQKGASASPAPSLSMETLTRLVADWKANERSRRAQFVTVRPVMPGWSEFIHEATLTGACNLKPRDEDPAGFMARLTAEQDHINGVIRDIGAAKGLLIDEEHPAHAVMSNLVKKAWVEVLEAEHRWRANDYSDLPLGEPEAGPPVATPPPRQLAPVPALAEVSTAENPLFSVAFEDWVRLGKPAGRTKTEAKTALRQFTEMHGDLPVLSIKKAHARTFRDALAKLPKNLTAEQKKVPLPVLIERATGDTRQPQTINKTLNLLGGILSRQAKEGIFDDVHWANPFSVHLDVADDDEDSYEPLTDTDLSKLFGSPVFSSGVRPKQGRGDTAFWAPLLVLFHGTRRQDVLQLFVRDIKWDAETDTHLIDVNRDDGKKVKNGDSVRQIPLHPKIIKLGFLDWVARREREVGPSGSLWPGFEDRAKLDGRINRWGKWFGDYLAKYGIDHPRKKLHSLRGTFKRVGRRCEVAEHVLSILCGHAIETVGGKYGRKKRDNGARDAGYPLNTLAAELRRVSFPGEDHLTAPAAKPAPVSAPAKPARKPRASKAA